jgi:heptosyltransferase-2
MNVALFLPGWIGDVVMATPAIRALRQVYPQARLVGVMKRYVTGVLEGSPWLDAVLPIDHLMSAAWALRREPVGLAVLFSNSFRTALVSWLGGCRRRVGYARYFRSPLLTTALTPERGVSPVLDAYNRLAEAAGCPDPGHHLELFTTPADEEAADQVWRMAGLGSNTVCLNPGAAFGAAKHWPVEHFARLAADLVSRLGRQALVLCGPTEREMAHRIAAGLPGVTALSDLESRGGPRLSLGLTKALVRRCEMLVTTDSGPRHFAHAFGRPVVTLFGPTHIGWTETYHPLAVHLQKKLPCGPCQKRVCPLGHHECMKTLLPGEVLAAVAQLLERKAVA